MFFCMMKRDRGGFWRLGRVEEMLTETDGPIGKAIITYRVISRNVFTFEGTECEWQRERMEIFSCWYETHVCPRALLKSFVSNVIKCLTVAVYSSQL